MDDGPSLRRVDGPELDAVESDPALVARIHAEIAAHGPMTFARFMEFALYDPNHGYYRSALARPGRRGDFLTAPEAHPIFARALARHAEDVWAALGRPEPFTIREYGSGSGALAAGLLERLVVVDSALATRIRYRPVEVEPRRSIELRERLATADLDDRLDVDDGGPIVGLVVANEVLDALPTHRVVQRGATLREIYVDVADGLLVDVEADPSSPALAARLHDEDIALADGQRAEICLALDTWVVDAAVGLARGVLLLIDYGHPARRLYDPVARRDGTLLAYLRHAAHTDPYHAVGRQDLTAHVDVTTVEAAAQRAGLSHLATTTQAAFLAGLGAGELLVELQSGLAANLADYLEARSALVRMIDPAAMGGFRVMAFGRGLADPTSLRGLVEAAPTRT